MNGKASRRFHASRTPGFGMFLEMDVAKHEAKAAGHEIIDLSVGSSDLLPPPEAIETLKAAVDDPKTYGYCLKSGTMPLLEAAANWYYKRYNIELDPKTEILSLIGAQEGLAHLLLAVADPGDVILMANPCYPCHLGAVQIAGLQIVNLPLNDDFLPDFAAVPSEVGQKAKLMLLNYPNNPTTAVADEAFFQRAVAFAEEYDLLFIHDNPYVDQVFHEPFAPSALAVPGARGRVVELFSFAKSYQLAGFRLGLAFGCADAIAAMEAVKGHVDFNQYVGIQRMGITCLNLPSQVVRDMTAVWHQRAQVLAQALAGIGWKVKIPKAGMYIWTKLPVDRDDLEFCLDLLAKTGLALAPGQAFGTGGKGYIRISLVRTEDVLLKAVEKIATLLPDLNSPAT